MEKPTSSSLGSITGTLKEEVLFLFIKLNYRPALDQSWI
jgi:hypothetical protein